MRSISPAEAPAPAGDRSIQGSLGGSRTTHVFVHSTLAMAKLPHSAAHIPGFDLYAERALLLARPQDVVCLPRPVEPEYLDFLGVLGLGVDRRRIVVVPEGGGPTTGRPMSEGLLESPRFRREVCELIDGATRVFLDPFLATAADHLLGRSLAATIGRPVEVLGGEPEFTERADEKHLVRAKAVELGVPVAEGEVVALPPGDDGALPDLGPLRQAIHQWRRRSGRILIRGSRGASGSATWIVEPDAESMERTLREIGGRRDNQVYLVEVFHELRASPNVQMHIDPEDGRISCLGVTDQELDRRLHHLGNTSPSRAATLGEIVAHATRLAEWMRAGGFRGWLGMDFGEFLDPADGRPRPFLAEINPRVNAATYALGLAEQLAHAQKETGGPQLEAFITGSFTTSVRSFAELRDSWDGLLFDPRTGKGVVPYNIGCLHHGRCGALVGAGAGRRASLRAALEALSCS